MQRVSVSLGPWSKSSWALSKRKGRTAASAAKGQSQGLATDARAGGDDVAQELWGIKPQSPGISSSGDQTSAVTEEALKVFVEARPRTPGPASPSSSCSSKASFFTTYSPDSDELPGAASEMSDAADGLECGWSRRQSHATAMDPAAPSSPAANTAVASPSSFGMLQELRMRAGGIDLFGEASTIFAGFDPKSKGGDICVPASDMPLAIAGLKRLIADQRAKKGKPEMWEFRASPYVQFGQTLDDLMLCFCMWARTEEDGGGVVNVSKAFRRLTAYAKFMHEHHDILTSTPLTAASCLPILKTWNAKAIHSTEGKGLVFFLDLATVDMGGLKETLRNFDVLLRVVVWLMHATMFDPEAQRHGLSLCYNLNCLDFVEAISLMPLHVVFKLEGLMIGAVPVKLQSFLFLDSPLWISSLLKGFGMLMSAKVRKRLVAVKKAWQAPAERFGADCIPKGFAQCGGGSTANTLY